MTVERERLIALANKLILGSYSNDAELDADMAEFLSGVPHPRASDLIFHWEREFDHQPSAVEVVERALAYRPIEL